MDKKKLTERDICTKFITPNLLSAGCDVESQIREEVSFTDGRIYVRGKLHAREAWIVESRFRIWQDLASAAVRPMIDLPPGNGKAI